VPKEELHAMENIHATNATSPDFVDHAAHKGWEDCQHATDADKPEEKSVIADNLARLALTAKTPASTSRRTAWCLEHF